MTSLLDLRFIMLSGKGGVGRTTVAATLARAAAEAGKRVLLAEASTADRLGRLFGRASRSDPWSRRSRPGIDAVNITPERALHEYGTLGAALGAGDAARCSRTARCAASWARFPASTRTRSSARPGGTRPSSWPVGRATTSSSSTAPRAATPTLMLRIPQAILDAMPKGPLAGDARAIARAAPRPGARGARDRDARRGAARPRGRRARRPPRAAALGVPLGPLIVNAFPTAALAAPAV